MARQAVKMVGAGIGSFILGAIVGGGLIVWGYAEAFRNEFYMKLLELTNTAYHIRSGRQQELLKTCEESLRQCVPAADSLWGDDEARLPAFWYVQTYYQDFELEVPVEVKPILDRLPPRPPCDLKRNQKAASQLGVDKN